MIRHQKEEPTSQASRRQHLALVGFMGSGKTSVGRFLAKQLGYMFVDLDAVIEQKLGKSVGEIFRDSGEVAFRARERSTLREVLNSDLPLVLATGGGTFVDASMRKWLKEQTRTIYLAASVEVLINRVGQGEERAQRPLLNGPDPAATIERLLQTRLPFYGEADIIINTDNRTLNDIVSDITRRLRKEAHDIKEIKTSSNDDMPALWQNESGDPLLMVSSKNGPYAIEMHEQFGEWFVQSIARVSSAQKIAVVSDSTVGPLHAQKIIDALKKEGKQVTTHVIPQGEQSKTLNMAAKLYDEWLMAGFTRSDLAIAVGGGVVGDLTGFAASTFLRGIAFVQVPTTTLAAVDSSVGGKTAVNTERGKNLVGTFYSPKAVLLCSQFLSSQSRRAHAAGLVEALKMAACMDAELFLDMVHHAEKILNFDPLLLSIIARAVALKADVVGRDETEMGERAVLNYGHTLGHAIETGEQYRLLHGEAVALGMVAESEWAEQAGLSQHITDGLIRALTTFEVPTHWRNYKLDKQALGLDKKRHQGGVTMPVVTSIGSYQMQTIPLDNLLQFLGG